jgi:hypothetical protein
MANTDGLPGGLKGAIGNVVVYQFMGKTVVRSMPTKKRAPAKGAQRKTQDDFAQMMKIMQAVKDFVKAGFHDAAEGRTAFQTALSVNIRSRSQWQQPGNLHWLVLSQGERAGASSLKVQCKQNQAAITWDTAAAGGISSADDSVMLLALNSTTLACTYNLAASTRKKGEAKLELPAAVAGEEILVFIAFRSTSGGEKKNIKNISDSQMAVVNC